MIQSADSLPSPRHSAPPGTCDTHMHVYGPPEIYPEAPTSRLPPPDAPLPAYREVMARLGIERVVIVQPSSYGTDNRCTLDAMRELAEGNFAIDTPVAKGRDEVAEMVKALRVLNRSRERSRLRTTSSLKAENIHGHSSR